MDIQTIKKQYDRLAKLAWEKKLDKKVQDKILEEFNRVDDHDKISLIDLIKDFDTKKIILTLPVIYRLESKDVKRHGIYLNAFATITMNHPDSINILLRLFTKDKTFLNIILNFVKARDKKFYNKHFKNINKKY